MVICLFFVFFFFKKRRNGVVEQAFRPFVDEIKHVRDNKGIIQWTRKWFSIKRLTK